MSASIPRSAILPRVAVGRASVDIQTSAFAGTIPLREAIDLCEMLASVSAIAGPVAAMMRRSGSSLSSAEQDAIRRLRIVAHVYGVDGSLCRDLFTVCAGLEDRAAK